MVLRIALSTIEHAVFESLCPGYTMDHQAAVESIFESTMDANGNPITYTISQFHGMFLAACPHPSSMLERILLTSLDHSSRIAILM